MSRPPVWQLIKEAIQNLGGKATHDEIRDFIKSKYGDVNDSTATCQIIVSSVNHPSRVHYPENKKPRPCNSQYNFLFNAGRGKVELSNPDTHGLWELRLNEYGKLEAARCGFAEGDPEAPVPDTLDELVFPLESHLRDFLASNIEEIKPNGQHLRLYADASGRNGIEYPTDVGPIDTLALDTDGHFVVFELETEQGPGSGHGAGAEIHGVGPETPRNWETGDRRHRRQPCG
jgi:hypothetical protein